jgi:glutamate synthase domain-containing protein 2/glutamate synthase domain-containing protein 1/glutamate synthase domain-containing protein 3
MLSLVKNNLHLINRIVPLQKTFPYGRNLLNSINKRFYRHLNMNEKSACGIGIIVDMNRISNRSLVEDANQMLLNMIHRGGCMDDPLNGDGAGIMVNIPHEFYKSKLFEDNNILLPGVGKYGTGIVFFPIDSNSREMCKKVLDINAKKLGLEILIWRDVNKNSDCLGLVSGGSEPYIEQIFVKRINNTDILNQDLYSLQKISTNEIDSNKKILNGFYICSLSNDTIVYKGQFNCEQLFQYYGDLRDQLFQCYMAMVHSRFSTNTQPSWNRAQPYRISCHNGELNTIDGNKNMVKTRESNMFSPIYGKTTKDFYPICTNNMSDSGNFDSFIQWMTMSSQYSLPEILMTTMPEAWKTNNNLSTEVQSFYKYHSCSLEPWDGPALIGFMNKKHIGVIQDRNGLRPSRYCLTNDDKLIISSESGVLHNIKEDSIKEMGGLLPGDILLVDMKNKGILKNLDVKKHYASKYDYISWVKDIEYLDDIILKEKDYKIEQVSDIENKFKLFGISDEVKNIILTPMFLGSNEPSGSMGNDTPLAFLSKKKRNIFDFFKHSFAQVTNPPIDSIRENYVMTLECPIGKDNNILEISKDRVKSIILRSPVLTNKELSFIKRNKIKDLKTDILDMTFSKSDTRNLKDIILKKCEETYNEIIDKDINTIVLTDRNVSENNIQIPSILMSSALHNYLLRQRIRNQVSIIVESGGVRESHQICCLLGFGVDAICPYMSFESIKYHLDDSNIPYRRKEIYENYRNSINKGIYKIMSKMGISSLQSYKGAGKFETIGFDKDILETCFPDMRNTINVVNFDKIKKIFIEHHENVYNDSNIVDGQYSFREGGEIHYNSPEIIYQLQKSVKLNNKEQFSEYLKSTDILNEKCTIRGLLKFKENNRESISIDEVESTKDIVKRFCTGAMSIGSISKEAHETIALGMNSLGGRSNTGEGGEDSKRFNTKRNSAIKQVASGRFGVSSNYLANADQIQIKMAQGAKPGEGGELPGFKVTDEMARLRNTKEGITLISPPPHHDIYSIEDLSQLIYDLQNANKNASISVKLVSNNGIGIIASGVAKCSADHIVVSGHDGGTGAASWNSIKYCGTPWEIGLTETHKTLVKNDLRHKVKLQVDGSIKTSRDVVIACLLGAEEFAFATIPLITIGCIMMRQCHLNICPVGIATQDPILRQKFAGKSENVINYFFLLAEEIRVIMAQLGFKTMDEMVGRYDKLKSIQDNIDLDFIVDNDINYNKIFSNSNNPKKNLDNKLNNYIINTSRNALDNIDNVVINSTINNLDRSIGTMLSYEISKLYGEDGLPDKKIDINLTGIAGQSLGAFLQKGVTIQVTGGCNDYVGKGISGGNIIVKKYKNCDIPSSKYMIVGNTCFYGGIEGNAYINGIAGNRFAVRNSGVDIVVEGIGTNGCEYMTGGSVVILGKVDKNLCAGMSGGSVYVYDTENLCENNINKISVDVKPVDKEDIIFILHQLKEHSKKTDSELSEFIINNWEDEIIKFKKIVTIVL